MELIRIQMGHPDLQIYPIDILSRVLNLIGNIMNALFFLLLCVGDYDSTGTCDFFEVVLIMWGLRLRCDWSRREKPTLLEQGLYHLLLKNYNYLRKYTCC